MTSTSPTKPLTMLDTNVLVDALYEDLEEYSAAVHLLTLAEEDGKRSRGKLIKNQ